MLMKASTNVVAYFVWRSSERLLSGAEAHSDIYINFDIFDMRKGIPIQAAKCLIGFFSVVPKAVIRLCYSKSN